MGKAAMLALALGMMGGCGVLDSIFGVNPETGDYDSSGSPASTAGNLLGLVVPWGSAAVGLLGGLYADLRRRKWLAAISTTAKGINAARAMKDADGKIDVAKLMEVIAKEQEAGNARGAVRSLVHKIEGKDL